MRKNLATGVLSVMLVPAAAYVNAQSNYLFVDVLLTDSEGVGSASEGLYRDPGTRMEAVFEDGSSVAQPSLYLWEGGNVENQPGGAPYLLRISADLLMGEGGTALGYGYLGSFPQMMYTAPLPSSKVELVRAQVGQLSVPVVTVTGYLYIADDALTPSIVLDRELSSAWIDEFPVALRAEYPIGNALHGRGSDEKIFALGVIQRALLGAVWGAEETSHQLANFGMAHATGPLHVSFSVDGYTTATATQTTQVGFEYSRRHLLTPTTGPSASELLRSIDEELVPPPAWLRHLAVSELTLGKAKWLYPPLNRHADANGDGIYDAADLVVVSNKERGSEN